MSAKYSIYLQGQEAETGHHFPINCLWRFPEWSHRAVTFNLVGSFLAEAPVSAKRGSMFLPNDNLLSADGEGLKLQRSIQWAKSKPASVPSQILRFTPSPLHAAEIFWQLAFPWICYSHRPILGLRLCLKERVTAPPRSNTKLVYLIFVSYVSWGIYVAVVKLE